MKTLVALLGAVTLLAIASAQTSTSGNQPPPSSLPKIVLPGSQPPPPADKSRPAPPAAGAYKTPPPAGKSAPPGAKTTPAPKAGDKSTAKKEEPPPKIEGLTIPRGEKGFLGIEIVNSNFKLSFYDAKKKPVPVDVARAVLRWDPKYKVGQERIVLTPGEGGKALTNSRSIRAPYIFKLYILLFKDAAEGEDTGAAESYVIDFRQ